MARTGPGLIGRDAELGRVDATFDAAREGRGGALVLRGEPGIGKTAILDAALAAAPDMLSLPAAGAELETDLAFAALHHLVAPCEPILDQLPEPHHGTLRVLLGDIAGSPPDRFRAGLAVLALLAFLARDRPVACVLDDAQWLDQASRQALAFAARRVEPHRVAVLVALRASAPEFSGLPETHPPGFEPFPLHKVHRLLEPGPVILIATASHGRPNVMTNGFHLAVRHDPPLVGCVVGPWDHSYETLRETSECVIGIPPAALLETVVDIGNCSGATVDKFNRFGLTALRADAVGPPLIGDCVANVECQVADDRLVGLYDLWLLEAVRAWVVPGRQEIPTAHHRGDGTFVIDGERVDLRDRMTKWPELAQP